MDGTVEMAQSFGPRGSPDLNVLDYFVWDYTKDSVEHKRDSTETEVEVILAAFNTITPEIIMRALTRDTILLEFVLMNEEDTFRTIPN